MINITEHTITVHSNDYGLKIIPRGSIEAEVAEALLDKHGETDAFWKELAGIEEIGYVAYLLDGNIDEEHRSRFSEDKGGIYFDNIKVPATFFRRAIRIGDLDRSIRFLERLAENPFEDNHRRAFDFIESSNLPLSHDGCILAYKSVRRSFYDWHSNSIRYYPGDKPGLKSSEVDTRTHELCSAGLHFCSYGYMSDGYFGGSQSRVVLLKVAPEDIASIPKPASSNAYDSYQNSKGRAFKVFSISALMLEDFDSFCELNERLLYSDGNSLESIINEYIDTSIPAAEEIPVPVNSTVENVEIMENMNENSLIEGDSFTSSVVLKNQSIYGLWIRSKEKVLEKVANILKCSVDELVASERFKSDEAPYPREMRFFYNDYNSSVVFFERPVGSH